MTLQCYIKIVCGKICNMLQLTYICAIYLGQLLHKNMHSQNISEKYGFFDKKYQDIQDDITVRVEEMIITQIFFNDAESTKFEEVRRVFKNNY